MSYIPSDDEIREMWKNHIRDVAQEDDLEREMLAIIEEEEAERTQSSSRRRKRRTYVDRERRVGKFRLPANADTGGVSTRLDDGVLRITVPESKEEEVKKEAKAIAIDEKKSSAAENVVNSAATKKEL